MKKETIIITILMTCILCLGGFIIYDQFFKENNNENLEDLSQELFAKIDDKLDGNYLFFSKNDLNYENIENTKKLQIVMTYYDLEVSENKNYVGNDICYEDYDHVNNNCYKLKIAKADFEKEYADYFGSDKSIKYENFSYFDQNHDEFYDCIIKGNDLLLYPSNGGDMGPGYYDYIKYNNIEQDGDNIILTVNYLRYLWTEELYADANQTVKIADTLISTELTDKEMFNKYEKNSGIFEITFKKDNLGNYIWKNTKFVEK
ncbi:MAG: hypothetical protein E7172_02315 [Firmicutes bacterium]|nr:hypothetical protein [Bacillota bacterium]